MESRTWENVPNAMVCSVLETTYATKNMVSERNIVKMENVMIKSTQERALVHLQDVNVSQELKSLESV